MTISRSSIDAARFSSDCAISTASSLPRSPKITSESRSDKAGAVVDEALAHLLDRGLQTIWMQIGVADEAAAARAEAKGVTVIMNRCPKIEYQRLHGELRMGGFNTGVISSRL